MSTTNNHSDISIQETPSGVSPTSGDGSAAATTQPPAEGGQTTLDANPPIRTQTNVNNVTGEGEQLSLDSNSANNPNVVKPPDGPANSASAGPTVRPLSPRSGNGTWINTEKLDLDAVENAARRTGTYTGALIMTAPVVPIVAALISAMAFIAQWPKGIVMPDWLALFIGTPLLLGTIPTLIVWLLLALLIRRLTAADLMDMRSFGLLLNRLATLDAQLSVLDPEQPGDLPRSSVTSVIASKEALNGRNAIRKKLGKRSLMWVTASGYINLWKEMHNAEAALIEIEPREIVLADALYDEMRIQGSNMQTSDELLRKLRKAVLTLDPSAENYLQPSTTSPQGNSSKLSTENAPTRPQGNSSKLSTENAPTSPQGDSSKLPTENAAANVESEEERQARSVLREVRHTLSEFRDNRWEAMARVRNQFVCTMIFTGLTTYVLLQFAIIAGATQQEIISATAFYLVGALVGLFSRLYNESQTSKSIDDYRLALSRLVATPLYCGLAAVGGVLITQKFTTLVDIYDLKNILSGLIVAAIFGLTPSLLINTLQKQTEQYKTDLKSTAASQGQGTKTS